jgi:hypothetical protein
MRRYGKRSAGSTRLPNSSMGLSQGKILATEDRWTLTKAKSGGLWIRGRSGELFRSSERTGPGCGQDTAETFAQDCLRQGQYSASQEAAALQYRSLTSFQQKRNDGLVGRCMDRKVRWFLYAPEIRAGHLPFLCIQAHSVAREKLSRDGNSLCQSVDSSIVLACVEPCHFALIHFAALLMQQNQI